MGTHFENFYPPGFMWAVIGPKITAVIMAVNCFGHTLAREEGRRGARMVGGVGLPRCILPSSLNHQYIWATTTLLCQASSTAGFPRVFPHLCNEVYVFTWLVASVAIWHPQRLGVARGVGWQLQHTRLEMCHNKQLK